MFSPQPVNSELISTTVIEGVSPASPWASGGKEMGFANPPGPGPDIPPTADAQKGPVE